MNELNELEQLKYPIGKFDFLEDNSQEKINNWIETLAIFPNLLILEVSRLSDIQLNTQYRPKGWTIRQVIHHCADSHLNSYTRLKLTLTEDKPTVKPYFEDKWADLFDSKNMKIEPSLKIIEGIHERWVELLKNLTSEDFEKTFIHPEQNRAIKIVENIAFYAWHCKHHLAHITQTKIKNNWK